MYLDILHVFYTYLKRVQDTFRIHIRYIRIHVYPMRFLDVTLDTYQNTSGYIRIHIRRETRELRHLLRLLRHLRHLRQLPRQLRQLEPWRPRSRPGAHPRAAASRARDTYPQMYPYVSDMYRECILCVMYLRVKIHCILNVS